MIFDFRSFTILFQPTEYDKVDDERLCAMKEYVEKKPSETRLRLE